MSPALISARIRALRDSRKLSQEELAEVLGFKDRQTVSAIETGERRVSAEELVTLVERLQVPLEFFTDPFRLEGEGRFSWRQTGVRPTDLDAYERIAGRLIAAYRVMAPQVGRQPPLLRKVLNLVKQSSYEDAMAAGERFAADFKLGDVPAAGLAAAMERDLGILVLMVDAVTGISGAACRLPEIDAVLINRQEVAGRRHFDLGHELFHILTWETMPPEHSEAAVETSKNRVEQLANNFASALLMPAAVLDGMRVDWDGIPQGKLPGYLNDAAAALQVTATALKWRLVALGRLKHAAAKAVPDKLLRNNGRRGASQAMPLLYSRAFVEVIALAIDAGRISARRAAGLLEFTLEELAELCADHGVQASIDV